MSKDNGKNALEEEPVKEVWPRYQASYQCSCPDSIELVLTDVEFVPREMVCTRCRRRVKAKMRTVTHKMKRD